MQTIKIILCQEAEKNLEYTNMKVFIRCMTELLLKNVTKNTFFA